ncbi:hypothetical protein [Hyphobacterium sp.]|uniref:hypothetical protein n=1 Tax=Hyphobacterium sp. TaxID=2004662 RepID=UPI003B5223F1
MITRLYEAGTTARELAEKTGHTERWVRNRIRLCRADSAEKRARNHDEAVRRELVRAEHVLLDGRIDDAIKQMRALTMLVKLEKELARAADPEAGPPAEAEAIESAKAELERRFARLRRAHGLPPVPPGDGGDASTGVD